MSGIRYAFRALALLPRRIDFTHVTFPKLECSSRDRGGFRSGNLIFQPLASPRNKLSRVVAVSISLWSERRFPGYNHRKRRQRDMRFRAIDHSFHFHHEEVSKQRAFRDTPENRTLVLSFLPPRGKRNATRGLPAANIPHRRFRR